MVNDNPFDTSGIIEQAPKPPDNNGQGSPPSPIQQLGGDIAGFPSAVEGGLNDLTGLIAIIGKIIPQTAALITKDAGANLLGVMETIVPFSRHFVGMIENGTIFSYKAWLKELPTSELFQELLTLGLGIDTDKFDDNANKGVKTVDSMIAFATIMSLSGAAINMLGKPLLGARWGEAISTVVGRLAEEMGLSWAMGIIISQLFETAVGESLAEPIRAQKRPARIEWPVLRTMLRQHVLEPADFKILMDNVGFPDNLQEKLALLVDVPIPVADIQQLYLYKLLDAKDVPKHLHELGFTDDQAALLSTLYIDKIQSQAAAELRTVARSLFARNLIDEETYRGYLATTNFPDREIDADIKAITLQHNIEQDTETVAMIHQQFTHGLLVAETATTQLIHAGQTQEQAKALVTLWSAPTPPRRHGLTESKILSYYASGIMGRDITQTRLQELNLEPTAITFLLQHPTAHSGVTVRRRTPGLIMEAYLVGALHEEQLTEAFTSAGVAKDDLPYWIATAKYRLSHRKAPASGKLELTRGEIVDAYKVGIYDQHKATAELEHLGYSTDNAIILLEIANKGVFQPPVAPLFATLQDAIAYMEAHGFDIIPPTDPKLLAAEGMLAMAGYSWRENILTQPPPISGPFQPQPPH